MLRQKELNQGIAGAKKICNYRVVNSPISRTISSVFVIAEIVENSVLDLDLQVYQKDTLFIKMGQKKIVTNNTHTAKVFNIGALFSGERNIIIVVEDGKYYIF